MTTMGVVAHDITIGNTALAWDREAPMLKWAVNYTVNVTDLIQALCQLTPHTLQDPSTKGRGLRAQQTDLKCAGATQVRPEWYKDKEYEEAVGRSNQVAGVGPDAIKAAGALQAAGALVGPAGKPQEVGQWNAVPDTAFAAMAQSVEWEDLPGATKMRTQTMAVTKKLKPAQEATDLKKTGVKGQKAPTKGASPPKSSAPAPGLAMGCSGDALGRANQGPVAPPPPPPPAGGEAAAPPGLPNPLPAKAPQGPPPPPKQGGARKLQQPPPQGLAPPPPQQEPAQGMAPPMVAPQPVAAASPAPPTQPPPPPPAPLAGQAQVTAPPPTPVPAKPCTAGGTPAAFGKGASPAATQQAKAVGEKQLECKTQ
mmetsp:Transcript_40304/g.92688  ORF Transcript_40304/g.92688 Transcript_40304/m.92688 type:complete len:367 (+) Transcript_40304:76-1176(+)